MPSLVGTTVAANYLKAVQSPGAALAGLTASNTVPLLTFSTPNLRLFRVSLAGVDLTATPGASDSAWSKAVRALQVTSELFAVFAPEYDTVTEGASTFCFMAPDFNSNVGPATTATDPLSTPLFTTLETAINAATGGTATVAYVALTGVAVA
jgi:hypothetical protein